MASMHWMSWRLSKWMPNIARSSNRGFATSPSTPIHWLPNSHSQTILRVPRPFLLALCSTNFSSAPPVNAERIRQMQEYFNQYADEYYEETEAETEREHVIEEIPEKRMSVESIQDIFELLESERLADIVVLRLGDEGPGPINTLIICSPFNARHGLAAAETLRKAARISNDGATKRSVKNGFGWFQVIIGRTQVHIMSAEIRCRFDLEGLWGAGEVELAEDDVSLLPGPRKA